MPSRWHPAVRRDDGKTRAVLATLHHPAPPCIAPVPPCIAQHHPASPGIAPVLPSITPVSPSINQHHPASLRIAQHHPVLPGITQHCPASPTITQHPPASPSTAQARSAGRSAPAKPFGARPRIPVPWQHEPLTMFSRKAGTRVALGSTTKASAEPKRAPCRASGRQESRGCRRAERCSSMGWSG